MSELDTFNGFPEDGLQFLRDIAENNNKEWFQVHKPTYESKLLAPAQDFVAALGSRLQKLDPAIKFDTRTDGRGVLMRFYRDTRFSKDKSPYKTNLAGMFTDGRGKKTERPAYGFHMGANSMELMAGMFRFSKPQLAAYRAAVADDASGLELVKALQALGDADDYHLVGEHYKRIPSGYDADHPRADLLRFAGLYVHPHALDAIYLTRAKLVDACYDHFRIMSPVYNWLVTYVANNS
ncbi:MAG: DUF2461 domain-containing protein [Candidatus Promineifilaceae bacterium]|nr:DUF2461 domain-containing protein [Candidatus Promineifilaceae bacterium]